MAAEFFNKYRTLISETIKKINDVEKTRGLIFSRKKEIDSNSIDQITKVVLDALYSPDLETEEKQTLLLSPRC